LIYTPDELEERLKIGDDFVKEIIERGRHDLEAAKILLAEGILLWR